jgi:choline dehydrogenase-like flavoprotein
MENDFDVIVIGGGAGGGTVATCCSASGKRVLLIERGGNPNTPDGDRPTSNAHDEQSTLIDQVPYDDRCVEIGGQQVRLYMGGVLGGGTSVYGGALIRPDAADFQPGRYYGTRISREIWDWPIEFRAFEPFLSAAEKLFRVEDTHRENATLTSAVLSGSGRSTDSAETSPGLPLAKVNERLMSRAKGAGMHPYRLPLAIDARTCLRCDQCAGYVCPTGARRSAAQLVQESIARGEPLTLLLNCEVEGLERGAFGSLAGIRLRRRSDGTQLMVRAKRYVLAAGAIGSAAILLKSGFQHPLIGRHFMMHYSPISIGLFAGDTGAGRTFIKQVGLSDFYFGTPTMPEKMGIVQSLPAPGPLMMARYGLRYVPHRIRNVLRTRMLPLVGIVEDLPDPCNRVTLSSSGQIRLDHSFSEYDRARGAALAAEMKKLLKATGALACSSGSTPSSAHVAHQCGTLRFGLSPEHAVADPECRLFDQPDVFIADGSFMPSSLGVGPSLTIIGNALRVARVITAEV